MRPDQGETASGSDAAGREGATSKGIGATLGAIRKAVVDVAALVAVAFVAWIVVREMLSGDYEVVALEIPPSLAQRFPGEVVSGAIRDGIAVDWRKAANSSPINVIQHDKEEPDITIGGSNLPLRYVAKLLRREFHRPIAEISGQMVEVGAVPREPPPASASATGGSGDSVAIAGSARPTVRLTLRNSVGAQSPFFDEAGAFDDVVQDAALATLGQIDPFAAVLAGSQGTREQRLQALRVANTTLTSASPSLDVGKALLAAATASYALDRRDEAERYLTQAIQRLAKPEPDHALLSVAQDGLAVVQIAKRDWLWARDAVARSLQERPGYDSAEYHRIEIDDQVSRAFFGNEGKGEACAAEASFRAAVANYERFFRDHPTFSVAYTQYATMRLIRAHWRRTGHEVPACDKLDRPEDLPSDQRRTKEAFDRAVTEDSRNYVAWFQAANFAVEAQDPQYSAAEDNVPKRGFLLDDAERDYREALALDAGDFYVWFRYGEALLSDVALRPTRAASLKGEAVTAYCKAIALNRQDLGLSDAARDRLSRLGGICKD